MAEESSRMGFSRRTERWSMRPTGLRASLLLCCLFLASVLWAGSAGAGAAAEGLTALSSGRAALGLTALSSGRAALERGDAETALKLFEDAAAALVGTGQPAERMAALAGVGQLRAAAGDVRGSLLAWSEALPLADALAAGDDPEHVELGVVIRLQLVELLRAEDPVASEQFAWDAVRAAVDTGVLTATAGPVSAVLDASTDEAGVRERLLELDELLAPLDGYRLHQLPRPQPLGWLAHDVARQYAEAGLLAEALHRFGLSVRVWLALGAEDLAARALVDLGRAAMDTDKLELAADALAAGTGLSPEDARLASLLEVEAWLRGRSGDPGGASRLWTALLEAEPVGTRRRASVLAEVARVSTGQRAIELHEQAAAAFRRAELSSLARIELISAAEVAARPGGATSVLRRLLDASAASGADDSPAMVPQRAQARWELARSELELREGQPQEARLALAAAGAIYFRVGNTDAVAYSVSQFVDAAIAEGDFEGAAEAGTNAVGIEGDLGLALDGWRAFASQARLHRAKGLTDQADRACAAAAERVERLASLGELEETDGVPGPVEAVYAPWVDLLLADQQVQKAFAVAQRAASSSRGLVLDGRRPGSALPGGFGQLRSEVGPLRDQLAAVSTRPGVDEPVDRRKPLLAQLGQLHARWDETVRLQRERMPRNARRELVSGCEVAEIVGRLPPGAVLYDEHRFDRGVIGFVVDEDGVAVLRPADPKSHPARKRLQRAREVIVSGATDVPARLSATVPVTHALLSCDLLEALPPTGDAVLRVAEPIEPREFAADVASRAFTGARAGRVPAVHGIAVHVDRGEPTRVSLDRFGEAGVVWVRPQDSAAVGEVLGDGSTLDELRRQLRRARVSVSVWLSPPAR